MALMLGVPGGTVTGSGTGSGGASTSGVAGSGSVDQTQPPSSVRARLVPSVAKMRSGAYVTEVCAVTAPSPCGRNASHPPPAYVGEELQACARAKGAAPGSPVAAVATKAT